MTSYGVITMGHRANQRPGGRLGWLPIQHQANNVTRGKPQPPPAVRDLNITPLSSQQRPAQLCQAHCGEMQHWYVTALHGHAPHRGCTVQTQHKTWLTQTHALLTYISV